MMIKKLGLFLGPLSLAVFLFTPPARGLTPEAWHVLGVAALMLIWWVSEAIPLFATALLPLIALPLLGINTIDEAAKPYASPIVFLFLGGFMIALAMERWELHRRIALNIVRITGTNADGIVLGFMLSTFAISMWISNTATAVMMLPIALSVINLLTRNPDAFSATGIRNFSITMMLAVAYGSNIGGMATIIGTPPNVVFAGYIRQTFNYEVSFAKWMLVGLPFSLILLAATYFLLVKLLFPNRLGNFADAKDIIQEELRLLGPMSVGEKRTLVIFVSTALAWIFRIQINQLLGIKLDDTIIAMIGALALFILPTSFEKGQFVLEWRDTEKLPWGILLLFGGGLSLAGALEKTGLIGLIGGQFAHMENATFLIIIGLAAVSIYLTEIMSNVALVTVLLPVVGGIAIAADIRPLMVCIPVTLGASCAFMLPMSTPPNAIVFASGHLTVAQMARAGFFLNLIAVLLVAILTKTLMPMVFAPIR